MKIFNVYVRQQTLTGIVLYGIPDESVRDGSSGETPENGDHTQWRDSLGPSRNHENPATGYDHRVSAGNLRNQGRESLSWDVNKRINYLFDKTHPLYCDIFTLIILSDIWHLVSYYVFSSLQVVTIPMLLFI